MAFRRRNEAIAATSKSRLAGSTSPAAARPPPSTSQPGVRTSPNLNLQTVSTGTGALDVLLGARAGQALGTSLSISETGSSDYAGILLRCYASEAILSGHKLHVVGLPQTWIADLPGVAVEGRESRASGKESQSRDKMKIAWRYQDLPSVGAEKARVPSSPPSSLSSETPFCHSFDLTKRLAGISPSSYSLIPINPQPLESDGLVDPPFTAILNHLQAALAADPASIHRLVIPSILSPLIYPYHSSEPSQVLSFFRSLRALLRQHPVRIVAMICISGALFPRQTALTRWMEVLSDGVIELNPFPETMNQNGVASDPSAQEERLQGLIQIHKRPVLHDRGVERVDGDDLAFAVSRKKFSIKPFSLPPVLGDQEAQRGEQGREKSSKVSAKDLEF